MAVFKGREMKRKFKIIILSAVVMLAFSSCMLIDIESQITDKVVLEMVVG